MFGDGKKQEVIIQLLPRIYESQPSIFNMGGVSYLDYDRLMVWCEHGYKSVLEKIEGVFQVKEDDPEPRYYIFIDPRYDTQWVIKEVEGIVKTTEPKMVEAPVENGNFRYVKASISSPIFETDPSYWDKKKKKGKKK